MMSFLFVTFLTLVSSEESFLWGTSGAAWQVEGCTTCDGRSPSIWDTFCSDPTKCQNKTAEPTALEYLYYDKDAQLAQQIGTNSYT